jgi:SP family arabinose:H+ symporter-like MFS transporter
VAVGINAVILYGPAILMRGGRDLHEALVGSIFLGAVNLAATIAAVPWIDRIGRKPLLLAGLAGTALSMAALGFFFRPGTAEAAGGSVWALASILAFVAFYAVSLGPITWILVAEIFPTSVSGAAMAVSLVAMYLADFAVTLLFPSLMAAMGGDGFFCFTAVSIVATVLVARFVPETKGRSLEQVHRSWARERGGGIPH